MCWEVDSFIIHGLAFRLEVERLKEESIGGARRLSSAAAAPPTPPALHSLSRSAGSATQPGAARPAAPPWHPARNAGKAASGTNRRCCAALPAPLWSLAAGGRLACHDGQWLAAGVGAPHNCRSLQVGAPITARRCRCSCTHPLAEHTPSLDAHCWWVPSTKARRCWCSCTFWFTTRSKSPGVSTGSWEPYTAAWRGGGGGGGRRSWHGAVVREGAVEGGQGAWCGRVRQGAVVHQGASGCSRVWQGAVVQQGVAGCGRVWQGAVMWQGESGYGRVQQILSTPPPTHLHAGHELGQLAAGEALRHLGRVRQLGLAHALHRDAVSSAAAPRQQPPARRSEGV